MSIYDLEAEGFLGNGEYDGETAYGQEYEEEFGASAYEAEEEFGAGAYGQEYEEEFGASAYEGEEEFGAGAYEFEWASESDPEMEQYVAEMQQLGGEYESPLDEIEEMELAARLLEVQDEEELEQFLGNLLVSAARKARGFLRSRSGKAMGGILKNVAKTALPAVGGVLGTVVAPGIGTKVGSQLGTLATRLFEVELERFEQEDQEFEVARRFVRLAATAARNAALAPRRANPGAVARGATLAAARRHAPGVYRRFPVFAHPAPWYWPQPRRRRRPRPRPQPVGGYAAPPAPTAAPAPPPAAAAPAQPPSAAAPDQEPGQPPAEEPAAAGLAGDLAGELYGEARSGRRGGGGSGGRAQSGRWVRRGRKLIVLGI